MYRNMTLNLRARRFQQLEIYIYGNLSFISMLAEMSSPIHNIINSALRSRKTLLDWNAKSIDAFENIKTVSMKWNTMPLIRSYSWFIQILDIFVICLSVDFLRFIPIINPTYHNFQSIFNRCGGIIMYWLLGMFEKFHRQLKSGLKTRYWFVRWDYRQIEATL